jgi:hypothetical protein
MGRTDSGKLMYIYAHISSAVLIYATTGKHAENYTDRKPILCSIYYWKRNCRRRIPQMVSEKIEK